MTVPLDRIRILGGELDHPEGLAWDASTQRIIAGGEAGQIYRVSLDGEISQVGTTDGFVLGVALDDEGRIYACDARRHAVLRVDPGSGSVGPYGAPSPMRSPNWLAFRPNGDLLVSDSGGWDQNDGCIWRIGVDGAVNLFTNATHRFPNGCCLNDDGTAIFVVESTLPGISRVEIQPDGSAGQVEIVAMMPDAVPDGIALTEDGRLVVACYRPDRICVVEPGGAISILVEDPRGTLISAPTNVAFAGDDLTELVIANLGRWHLSVIDAGIRGVALARPTLP